MIAIVVEVRDELEQARYQVVCRHLTPPQIRMSFDQGNFS